MTTYETQYRKRLEMILDQLQQSYMAHVQYKEYLERMEDTTEEELEEAKGNIEAYERVISCLEQGIQTLIA